MVLPMLRLIDIRIGPPESLSGLTTADLTIGVHLPENNSLVIEPGTLFLGLTIPLLPPLTSPVLNDAHFPPPAF